MRADPWLSLHRNRHVMGGYNNNDAQCNTYNNHGNEDMHAKVKFTVPPFLQNYDADKYLE